MPETILVFYLFLSHSNLSFCLIISIFIFYFIITNNEKTLSAGVHESIFKIIFLDIGLFHASSGVYSETAKEKDFNAIFKGAVAEQFVGQELIACQSPYTKADVFYWGRRAKSSTAEIDYLIEKEGQIIPVEVKSGPTGRMKSLHMYINKHQTNYALKISQAKFQKGIPVISLPFYAIESFLKRKEL